MAVVAFPFSTCFTSEEIEDVDSLQPYCSSSNEQAEKKDFRSQEPGPSEDSTSTALATAEDTSDQGDSIPDPSKIIENQSDIVDDMVDETMVNIETDVNQDASLNEPKRIDERQSDDAIDNMIDEAMGEDEDYPDQMEMEWPTNSSAMTKTYGGLRNLGNTCYLNSSLQMLASLDNFKHELEKEPAADSLKPALRRAFFDVLESLERGETVDTSDFKNALDERTSLFLGYNQEDSHEFLTTLLDLLDADYKTSKDDESMDEDEDKDGDKVNVEDHESQQGDDLNQQETILEHVPANLLELANDDDNSAAEAKESVLETEPCLQESHSTEICQPVAKKPRSLGDQSLNHGEVNEIGGAGFTTEVASQQFSDLREDGIEELLRWNTDKSSEETKIKPAEPKYKLAGGRMTSPDLCARSFVSETERSVVTLSQDVQSEEEGDGASRAPMSPVDKYFQMEVRVRLTCESCKYTRAHRENYLHLSLEIGNDESGVAGNVEDGLRNFFAPEKREIKCEKCFCASALQTTEITRLPVALLLHFKRFIVDVSDDYTSITYRKNQSDVSFDESIDLKGILSEFVAEDLSLPENFDVTKGSDDEAEHHYHIRSIVNHIGSSASCGHYTADAFRAYEGEGRRWNRFNDSYVADISPETAMRESTRTAYMVMYELTRKENASVVNTVYNV